MVLFRLTMTAYSCSKNFMRLSVEGCVLNMLLNQLLMPLSVRACGWMINSCSTSSRPFFMEYGLLLIFLNAEARARGLPHISAPPASAMYSRLRLMAKRVSSVKKYPMAASTTARRWRQLRCLFCCRVRGHCPQT